MRRFTNKIVVITGGSSGIGLAALLSAKLLKHATLKIYPGLPHGLLTTNADVISQDLLAFVRG